MHCLPLSNNNLVAATGGESHTAPVHLPPAHGVDPGRPSWPGFAWVVIGSTKLAQQRRGQLRGGQVAQRNNMGVGLGTQWHGVRRMMAVAARGRRRGPPWATGVAGHVAKGLADQQQVGGVDVDLIGGRAKGGGG